MSGRFVLGMGAVTLGLALAATLSLVGSAPAPRSHVASLRCGEATFRLASRVWPGSDAPLAPAGQALSVATMRGHRAVNLPKAPRATVDGRAVGQEYVGSWACVRADDGRSYLDLGFACAVDPVEDGACGGEQEWFRLVDSRGRLLGAATPRQGPAQVALQRRLGLARVMASGVRMTSVLDN